MAGDIKIILDLDSGQFTINTQKAGKTLLNLGKDADTANRHLRNIDRGVNGLIPKMRDLFITVSVLKNGIVGLGRTMFGWQKSIIDANAAIERMTFQMQNLSDKLDVNAQLKDAKNVISELFDTAERAPFALSALTNTAVKMKSVGIDPLDGSMQSLVDAVAQFGGTDDVLARASIAIQQMAGKGVISMEELRQQLGEAVPTAIKAMAASLGLTFQELVDAISRGQVLAQPALKALFSEFERSMGGAAQRMMSTWTGMTKVLETRWLKFQLAIGDTGFLEASKDALARVIDALDPVTLENTANAIGNALTKMIHLLERSVEFIQKYGTEIKRLVQGLLLLGGAFAALKITGAVLGVFSKGAGLIGALVTSVLAAKSEMFAFKRATEAAAAGVVLKNAKTKILSSSLAKLFAAAGPIGVGITIIGALIAAYQMWGREGEKALEKIRNGHILLEKEEQENAKNEMKRIERRMRYLKGIREEMGDKPVLFDPLSKESFTPEKVNKELEELAAAYNSFDIALAGGLAASSQRTANKQLQDAERAIAESLAIIQAKYRTARNQLTEKLRTDDNFTNEDFVKSLTEKAREQMDSIGVLYDNQIKILQNQLKSVSENDPLYASLSVALDELIIKRDEAMSRLSLGIAEIGNPEALGEGNNSKTKLERFLDRQAASIAKFSAAIKRGSTHLGAVDEFMQKLRDGYFGDEGDELLKPQNIAQLQQAIAAVKQAADLKLKFEGMEEANKKTQQLSNAFLDLQVRLEENKRQFTLAGEGVDEYVRSQTVRIEKLIREAELTSDQAEVFRKLGRELVEQNALMERAIDIKSENMDMTIDLMEGSQKIQAEYARERAEIETLIDRVDEFVTSEEEAKEMTKLLREQLSLLNQKELRDLETPVQQLARDWAKYTENMQEATASWLDDATRRLADFVATGKLNFADLAQSIVSDIIRIQLQAQIAQAITGASGGGGLFGSILTGILGSFGGSAFSSSTASQPVGGPNSVPGDLDALSVDFATGGVMTSRGPLDLKRYAEGGIATKPQLALFGEGRQNEAFVPLPDGRSIPVVQKGSGSNVTLNLINESGVPLQSEETGGRFDGEKYVKDVVLKLVNRPGAFRDQLKGALK